MDRVANASPSLSGGVRNVKQSKKVSKKGSKKGDITDIYGAKKGTSLILSKKGDITDIGSKKGDITDIYGSGEK